MSSLSIGFATGVVSVLCHFDFCSRTQATYIIIFIIIIISDSALPSNRPVVRCAQVL